MLSMSMNLSHPKSENGLPLRWRTCTASSTSMSLPSPGGVPPTHTSYAWMIARSSTNARFINLVSNPTPRLSPHGAPAFPQTHDDDSRTRPCLCRSSLDDAWSRRHVAARRWSRRGTVQPSHHAVRVTSMGEHARRMIDAWPCLESPISPLPLGERRGEGRAAPGRALAIHRLPYAGLKIALGVGIVPVSRCSGRHPRCTRMARDACFWGYRWHRAREEVKRRRVIWRRSDGHYISLKGLWHH